MKILLVEDNLLNQKVVAFNLRKQNYEVDAVIDGDSAIKKFKEKEFDLVLMDIMLPGINGYETTRIIREYEKSNSNKSPVPIIALTANTLDNDRKKCIENGMDDYLAKPFSAQELVDIIEKNIAEKK